MAVRGKAGSSLGQEGFEGSEKEMLKRDFLWQPLHVDTAPLGQVSVPKAAQPKGLSAWRWRTLFSDRPWGQEKRKVHSANKPTCPSDIDQLHIILNLGCTQRVEYEYNYSWCLYAQFFLNREIGAYIRNMYLFLRR